MNNLGRAHACLGDYSTADSLFRRALSTYEEIGNRIGQAEAMGNLGWVEHLQGNHDTAADLLHQALTIFRTIPYSSGEETETLNRIGAVAADLGDMEQALSTFERALGSARRGRNRIEQARALEGLARCVVQYEDGAVADGLRAQAMDIYSELGAAEARPAVRLVAGGAVATR